MRSIRYIFNNIKRTHVMILIAFAIGIVVTTLPFVFHEELGNEDYIYPKSFLAFTAIFFTILTVTNGLRGIAQNKLVPSMPIARELYTKAVPAFISVTTAGIMAVLVGAYSLFLGIIGAETVQFADTLTIAGIALGAFLLGSPIIIYSKMYGIILLYVSMIPLAITIVLTKARSIGFGIPIWAGAAIFLGAIIIGTVWMFAVSRVQYRRRKQSTTPHHEAVERI